MPAACFPDLLAQEHSNHDAAHNVVDEYHQRNRFPRPPDPSSLRNVRLQQHSSNIANLPRSRSESSVPSDRAQTPPVLSQVPSTEAAPGPLTGPATRLRAYPHKFREVIERAKQISQCECALSNPFPARSEFLDRKSGEHFTEAIAESPHVPEGACNYYKRFLSVR